VFTLVLLLVTGLPLIGMVLMERGAAGPNVYQFGYPNGSTAAYATHLLVFYLAYAVVVRVGRRRYHLIEGDERRSASFVYSPMEFRRLFTASFVSSLTILLILLFVCGAIDVVRGLLEKGQLRNEVRFAIFAYLARDFLTPMLVAVVAFSYKRTSTRFTEHLLMGTMLTVAAVCGAVWGYRASSIMAILPALFILFPRLNAFRALAALAIATIIVTFASIVLERLPADAAFAAVIDRATVGTGDSAWKMWEIATLSPESLPPYWPTLLASLGGRIGSLVAAAAGDPVLMINLSDYSMLVTYVVKNFAPGVDATTNVTTTVFGEGLLAFGDRYYLVLSAFAGIVTGLTRVIWLKGVLQHRPLLAVMASMYFMTSIFTWLNSGGIIALFAIPSLTYYGVTFVALLWLHRAAAPQASLRAQTQSLRGGAALTVARSLPWQRRTLQGVPQSIRRSWSVPRPASD